MKHVRRGKAAHNETGKKGKGGIGKWYVYQVNKKKKL